MAEHYLNTLHIRLRGYVGGYPLPENLAEEISLEVIIEGLLDLEELANDVAQDVGGGPRRVRQTYTEQSWDASGSGAELLIDVPTMISGAASLAVLWDSISRRILRRGKARIFDAKTQIEVARDLLAESLNVATDDIKVVHLEQIEDRTRIILEAPDGAFEIEIDNHGVTYMRRHQ
jgi:hypothetical protein